MGGIVRFSESIAWAQSGWTYRTILNAVCQSLRKSNRDPVLLEELTSEAGGARALQYLDVSDWSREQVENFHWALQDGRQQACFEASAHARELSDGFASALEELVYLSEGARNGRR